MTDLAYQKKLEKGKVQTEFKVSKSTIKPLGKETEVKPTKKTELDHYGFETKDRPHLESFGNPEQCILESQNEFLKMLLNLKIKTLKEEHASESEIFEKTGFYSNRDTEEIEKELKTAETVLKNIDNLPRCKND